MLNPRCFYDAVLTFPKRWGIRSASDILSVLIGCTGIAPVSLLCRHHGLLCAEAPRESLNVRRGKDD